MSNDDPFPSDGRGDPAHPARRSTAWGLLVPVVTLALMAGVSIFVVTRPERPRPPAQDGGIAETSPLPPPDDSPAMRAVRDETPIRYDETAAYAELLGRARRSPLETLREEARTDVVFSDLLERPGRYRGLPIRLQGTARRILRLEDVPDRLSPDGQLFEAWAFTGDSRGYPYVLVFEDPPAGLPGGDDVDAFVIFHGYFFKLLAYNAADKPRKAPMLIGRLEYLPDSEAAPAIAPGGSRPLWLLAPVALLLVYLFVRTMTTARTIFGSMSRRRPFHARHRDEISPEELDQWLQGGDQADDQGESPPKFSP